MFDTIEVNITLPVPPSGIPCNSTKFETKDLHNSLHSFKVRKNGQLWLRVDEYEMTPEDERPDPTKPWFGSMELVSSKWQYDRITKKMEISVTDRWQRNLRYILEFKNGRVISTECIGEQWLKDSSKIVSIARWKVEQEGGA